MGDEDSSGTSSEERVAGSEPAPSGRAHRGRTWVVAAVASLVLAVAVGGSWAVLAGDDESPGRAAGVATAEASPSPSPTQSPTQSAAASDGTTAPPEPAPDAAPAPPESTLPGPGALDGYLTAIERSRLGGPADQRGEDGVWLIDPCSDFAEPNWDPEPIVDYLAVRVEAHTVVVGVVRSVPEARSVLQELADRVAECGQGTEAFGAQWSATSVGGMGDEAMELVTYYPEYPFELPTPTSTDGPSVVPMASDGVVVRVANVILTVGDGYAGVVDGQVPTAVSESLRADTEAELAALTAHLGLDG